MNSILVINSYCAIVEMRFYDTEVHNQRFSLQRTLCKCI